MKSRIVLLLAIQFAGASAVAADPEKPVVLSEDELAVLADMRSPDRKTVIEKYDGKLVKFVGKATYQSGGGKGKPSFVLEVPGKTAKDAKLFLSFAWSEDPAMAALKQKVISNSGVKTATPMTIYGQAKYYREPKLTNKFAGDFGLLNVTTDPKTGGLEFTPKK